MLLLMLGWGGMDGGKGEERGKGEVVREESRLVRVGYA